jgi:hypothetical protein
MATAHAHTRIHTSFFLHSFLYFSPLPFFSCFPTVPFIPDICVFRPAGIVSELMHLQWYVTQKVGKYFVRRKAAILQCF